MAKRTKSTDSLYIDKLEFDPKLENTLMSKLISNVRLVVLALIALVFAGVFAFINLPRELNPEVDLPFVSVVTTLPGASPGEVERLITTKLEKEIANIVGVDQLSSQSSNSVSAISITFLSSVDPDKAVSQVKEKVDLVVPDLPEDASVPNVSKLDFNEQPVLIVTLTGPVSRISLSQTAEQIKQQLEETPGIRKVTLSGQEIQEVKIDMSAETLGLYKISLDSIANVLKANNLTFPAGQVTLNQNLYSLSLASQLDEIDKIRQLPLSTPLGSVTLSDVASIYLASRDSTQYVTTYLNKDSSMPGVSLSIFKSETETISDSAKKALAVIDEKTKQESNIDYIEVINDARLVDESFDSLTSSFRDTIILVFLVLFLFIGLRPAGITSLSIPLTFLSAFILMQLTGITLNFLSLFSLLLALGLVVDDAIVIVQASSSYGRKFPPKQTGLLIFRDLIVPVWTTTLTTVWAFLPLLLATGIIGEFIKSIPIVVSAALLSSTTIATLLTIPMTVILARPKLPNRVVVSLTVSLVLAIGALLYILSANSPLVPLVIITYVVIVGLAAKYRKFLQDSVRLLFKKRRSDHPSRLSSYLNQGVINFSPVARKYKKLLDQIIRTKSKRIVVYVTAFLFVALSVAFLVTGLLKTEFFPKTDSDNLYVNVELPAGSKLEQTITTLDQVADSIVQVEGVKTIVSQTGSSYSNMGGGAKGENFGFLTLSLVKEQDRELTSIEIAAQVRQLVEPIEAEVSVVEVSSGPPAGADFQVNIKGEDLSVLEQISQDFQGILESIPEAINTESNLKQSIGEIQLELIPAEMARRNLSAAMVGASLRGLVSGSNSTTITVDNTDLDVVISLAQDLVDIDALSAMTLTGPTGEYTLAEIANIRLVNSPVTIYRDQGQRSVQITAASQGVSSQQLLDIFQAQVNSYQMPDGYSWEIGGANEENVRSVQSIIQAMSISALLILITVVLQLNSFRKAFLVMVVIPLAMAGVFFNFTIFSIPLSFPALIGVLALFGIVVNNSILLVDKINQNLKFGLKLEESITDACSTRIEPILLTSLTTAAGLLPITLSDPLWQGLGGAIIAGLSVSGLLVLLLLPTLYYEIFKREEG